MPRLGCRTPSKSGQNATPATVQKKTAPALWVSARADKLVLQVRDLILWRRTVAQLAGGQLEKKLVRIGSGESPAQRQRILGVRVTQLVPGAVERLELAEDFLDLPTRTERECCLQRLVEERFPRHIRHLPRTQKADLLRHQRNVFQLQVERRIPHQP